MVIAERIFIPQPTIMGVEYKHFLVPENSTFIPAKSIFAKVDAVLEKWKLKAGAPEVYDLTEGNNESIESALDEIDIGHGIAVQYSHVEGKQIKTIMGESYNENEVNDEYRYIQYLILIAGTDFRIHPANEQLLVEIIKPPMEDGKRIEAYCEYDELTYVFAEAYHSSISTLPPKVFINVTNKSHIIGNQDFNGFWRTAFIIDCGKDLPKIGEFPFFLPNADFVADMEQAFGTKLLQIGEVY